MTSNQCRCDLHIHSTFSDSDASVEEIFKAACRAELKCISITDHDTVLGSEQARACSEKYGIEFIDGIELSAQEGDAEVHILGYFVDPNNKKLVEYLAHVKELRKERLVLMSDKLNSIGIAVDKDELMGGIGDNIPTRLHLGMYLMKKGYVNTLVSAFKRYLSPKCPAYVPRAKLSVKEIVELIRDAGGFSFMAHPRVYSDQSWIKKFIDYGVDGIEINYPRLPAVKLFHYINIAKEHGLLKSGGSDAHGTYKEFTKVGGVSVPYEWVEEMKKRKQQGF